MVQATDGLELSTYADATGTECYICGKKLKFEDTPKDVDVLLAGMATATHCEKKYVILPTGKFRMTVITDPEVTKAKAEAEAKEKEKAEKEASKSEAKEAKEEVAPIATKQEEKELKKYEEKKEDQLEEKEATKSFGKTTPTKGFKR